MGTGFDSQDQAIRQAFGRRLQDLRLAAGLSQGQMAERIGRSVEQIAAIENGRTGTSILIAARIAGVLGITLPDLFDLDDQPANDTDHRRALRELIKTLRPETAHRIKLLTKLWATVRPELR